MNVQGNPPPGWHPDPYRQAQFRYWDGNAWTGYTSGPPQTGVVPLGGSHRSGALPAPTTSAATTRPAAGAGTQTHRAGPFGPLFSRGFIENRLANRNVLAIFLGSFASLVVVGVIGIVLLGRADPAVDCPSGRVCSDPPVGRPFVNLTVWRSDDLGYQVAYDEDLWSAKVDDGRTLLLTLKVGGDLVMRIGGATDATPRALLDQELERLGKHVVGLTEDTDPADRLHGPSLGYIDGVGGAHTGPIDTPQGVVEASAVVMAAAERDVTAYASIVTTEERAEEPGQADEKDDVYGDVDSVLNTFLFPSEDNGS